MTAQLRTRKPTGKVPFPLLVIAGAEKTGKSYSTYNLSSSERVGRTFVFDIGEAGADEYAELGPYEIVEHDGTYTDIVEQLEAACALPTTDGKPNVIILDSGTNLWDLLKDEAVKAAQKKGKSDPTMDLWNKAKDRWRRVIDQLIRYPGIAIVTARAGEVVDVDADGKPVKGGNYWKIQAEKNLGYDANVIVKTTGPGQAEIIGARSLHLHVPAGRTLPVPGFTLDKVIFDMLKADGGLRDLKVLSADLVPVKQAKIDLLKAYQAAGYGYDAATRKGEALDLAAKAWGARGNNAIPRTELDQLLAAISEEMAPFETPKEGESAEGADGKGSPAPTEAHAQGGTSEADDAGEPAPELSPSEQASVSPGTNGSSDAPGPDATLRLDTSKLITKAQAQKLHRDLGRSVDSDGYGLGKDDQEELIFCITNGRTTHASEMTVGEEAQIRQFAGYLNDGRMTIGDVHRAAQEHRDKQLHAQLEQSVAPAEESEAVRAFDEAIGLTQRAS